MAILKGIAGASSKKNGSKNVLDYVGKKAELTFGINCSSDYKEAFNDFQATKEIFKKEEGRQYLHYVQSFSGDEVTPEQALELTKKFCEKAMKDCDVFLAVHNETDNVHCHIVINSVNNQNGKKIMCQKKEFVERDLNYEYKKYEKDNNYVMKQRSYCFDTWKEKANEINLEAGLKIPEKSEKKELKCWNKNEYQMKKKLEEEGKLTDKEKVYYSIGMILEEKNIKSYEEFSKELKNKNIIFAERGKNLTFELDPEVAETKKSKFRLSTLAKDFNHTSLTKENLETLFKMNLEKEKTIEKAPEKKKIEREGRGR